jgi:methylated-DNA-[protein]-cysteine S-methyltransferase
LSLSCFKRIDDAWFGVVLDERRRVLSCGFSLKGREDVHRRVLRAVPNRVAVNETEDDEFALSVLRSMRLIFAGKDPETLPAIAFENLPAFTRASLMVTSKIPRGYVSTYGAVAAAAGRPGAARAVGNAEARNPFAPFVPCHRVVNSTRSLGGYGGGLPLKKALLAREGVLFEGSEVSRLCLWAF